MSYAGKENGLIVHDCPHIVPAAPQVRCWRQFRMFALTDIEMFICISHLQELHLAFEPAKIGLANSTIGKLESVNLYRHPMARVGSL